MEMFIKYQVPADLLSYDGKPERELSHKIAEVKRNVSQIQEMVNEAKAKELEEKRLQAEYERARRIAEERQRAEEEARRRAEEMQRERHRAAERESRSSYREESSYGMIPQMQMMNRSAAVFDLEPSFGASPMLAQELDIPAEMERIEVEPPEPAAEAEPSEKAAENKPSDQNVADDEADELLIDYTQMPGKMDGLFNVHDKEGGVRPTKIKPGTVWRKKFQKALLAQPSEKSLDKDGLRDEKNMAFDLLDALSKSG